MAKNILVIVESPTKAKTIGGYLGTGYHVEASVGHIRDLPKGTKDLPAEYKKQPWARLAVNVDHEFEPVYVSTPEKKKTITRLRSLMKDASEVYLATDEDREGEAISWHLLDVLKPKVPVKRLAFHEITRNAIAKAIENPRDINEDLVHAQETRRIIDRLYGYELSPLLWRKINPNLSAGRVQSVALRLIVERERERMAFLKATFWSIIGTFVPTGRRGFDTELISVGGAMIPTGKDFNETTGRLKHPEKFLLLTDETVRQLTDRLAGTKATVDSVEKKPYRTQPYPPFTTSTLQQEANRKLNFTARQTMRVAQSLYENGFITYMRTDSTSLSSEAIATARSQAEELFGKEYVPEKPRFYQTKVKNAQEAHEAIRPAGSQFRQPGELRGRLSGDELALYSMIWKRTLACQMKDAVGTRTTVVVAVDDTRFRGNGKTIEFPGYLRAYVENSDDPAADLADRETILPEVHPGEELTTAELKPHEHNTMPPPRFTEAALTKALEEKGIGRPSTYATIIDTLLSRHYAFKKANALVPTWTAFTVCRLLESHFASLIDYQFTAEMENELDAISCGEMKYVDYLRRFYFGDAGHKEQPGLQSLIKEKTSEIDARDMSQFLIGTPEGEKPIYVRVGQYGTFLQQGDIKVSIPDTIAPDELTLDKALEFLHQKNQESVSLGVCPETGEPIFLKVGRYGPYVQRGLNENGKKAQNASLLRGMAPETVDLETALALLSLPRRLGVNDAGEEVLASNGRYGPFVKCGDQTRTLDAGCSPLTIDLPTALEILARPKFSRQPQAPKPKKSLGDSPVTGKPVELLDGRYGPYVTDGEVNASVPKNTPAESVDLAFALDLLAKRTEALANGTARVRRRSVKKTTAKKTAAKKTAAKKTAVKKTVKKAAAKKTVKKAVKKAAPKDAPSGGDAPWE
ncbi:MAG: type I DNA topoisomerase [Thermoguttaceae bacterium]|nr:type I DNA topoisomerase [Thermoguttaceae bacterium]